LEHHVAIFDGKVEIHPLQARKIAEAPQFLLILRQELDCILDLTTQVRELSCTDAHVHP
jgi:hypothetical protein